MSSPLPTAIEMKEVTNSVGISPAGVLRCAVMVAIYTAAALSLHTTAAITIGAVSEAQLLAMLVEIHQAGFSYTLSATTFTVFWNM